MATTFEEGLLVGLLIGEGHFGGDGRQPQITLRMHERHEALFRWLETTFQGGRLYGPYDHGGRRYYQWMARGAYLREHLVPLLRRSLSSSLDRYAQARFLAMCDRYARQLGLEHPSSNEQSSSPPQAELHSGSLETSPERRAAEVFAALRRVRDPGHPDHSEQPAYLDE